LPDGQCRPSQEGDAKRRGGYDGTSGVKFPTQGTAGLALPDGQCRPLRGVTRPQARRGGA